MRKLREVRRQVDELGDWLREDPKVEEVPVGGTRVSVRRLFQADDGTRLVVDSHGAQWIVAERYDGDGWLRSRAWTRGGNRDVLRGAIESVGITGADADRIAREMEPLVEAHRVPRTPPHEARRNALRVFAWYGLPWGFGVTSIARNLIRGLRRMA